MFSASPQNTKSSGSRVSQSLHPPPPPLPRNYFFKNPAVYVIILALSTKKTKKTTQYTWFVRRSRLPLALPGLLSAARKNCQGIEVARLRSLAEDRRDNNSGQGTGEIGKGDEGDRGTSYLYTGPVPFFKYKQGVLLVHICFISTTTVVFNQSPLRLWFSGEREKTTHASLYPLEGDFVMWPVCTGRVEIDLSTKQGVLNTVQYRSTGISEL